MLAPSPTQSALRTIVAAASSLEERLCGDCIVASGAEHTEEVETRLTTWCQVIARGNWELFQRRLAWDGLDVETVRKVLSQVQLREGAELPSWAITLETVLQSAPTLLQGTGDQLAELTAERFLVPGEPIAFEELLIPFILIARQRLLEQASSTYQRLSDKAHSVLERDLLQNLSTCAIKSFHLEFSIHRAQAISPLARLLLQQQNDDTQELYHEFVEQMLAGGLLPFFQRYPVLARVLATITDLWIEANIEFLQRLSNDWTIIEHTFAQSQLQQVIDIEAGLSDPHHGRRSVLALTFTSGHKLVYKPKPLGIEAAYNQLLTWYNTKNPSLTMKALTVLDRGEYGWVEFVEVRRCKDAEEARRYFQRAGILLCLIYALVGTDCHHENLIVHGEYPVLIDAEALMQHRARLESMDDGAQAQLLAHEMIAESVLHTGFLPSWQVDSDGQQAYDISGLRGPDELIYETEAPRWEYINTDRMELKTKPVRLDPPADYLAQQGVPLYVGEHSEDVIAGFEQCYHFLLTHREELLQPGSPLYALKAQPLRLIYRNTHVYGSLTHQLFVPRYLQDGVDRSIQLEALGIAFLPAPEVPLEGRQRSRWWPVFGHEKYQMEHLDIPFFSTASDSDALFLPGGDRIAACFQEASFDLVLARLQSLSVEDLERQVGFIAGSLYALVARDPLPVSITSSSTTHTSTSTDTEGMRERFIAHVLRLAAEIEQNAIRASDGSASWIVPQYMFSVKRYQLQPIGSDLYTGSCGVTFFLAALEHVTGGAGYRTLALGALQALRETLRLHGPSLLKNLGIGAASGLASVIYTLMHSSRWLDEPALLEEALHAVRLITRERIQIETALDTFGGIAGTLLVLLTLYDLAPDPALLEKAVACGQRLLETRVSSESGYRSWPSFNGIQLTGFSHGAAGITYALLRLYEATGNSDYLSAASEGIAYEDSLFSPEINTWPDLRSGDPLDYRVAWCHGAPGIGLARMAGLSALNNEQVRNDIEIALQRTQEAGVQSLDHLCCGNMGRIDILSTAARLLNQPELAATAEHSMQQVVLRAEQAGRFALDPALPQRVNHFGFFQGTSGFGYSLLRMAYPGQLPCVLLWE